MVLKPFTVHAMGSRLTQHLPGKEGQIHLLSLYSTFAVHQYEYSFQVVGEKASLPAQSYWASSQILRQRGCRTKHRKSRPHQSHQV